jgi:hypothetical protein
MVGMDAFAFLHIHIWPCRDFASAWLALHSE